MNSEPKLLNIALGGGGVKGIAFIGAFDAMERRGYSPGNIVGVSAGSIAGVLAASGYNSLGLWNAMDKLDFGNIEFGKITEKVPAIKMAMDYYENRINTDYNFYEFLSTGINIMQVHGEYRSLNIFKNIIAYCKQGCLFDGDLLEEWVSTTLAQKGIRTFADLRGGKATAGNPRGYKIRMTGVDCNRLKLIILPDDLAFYDIDPDSFDVAKAVRISTSVPFAFKPVELVKTESGKSKVYNLIDGGVLDSFPGWLLYDDNIPGIGLKLVSADNKLNFLYKPLDVLKGLISTVHDLGIPSSDNGKYQQSLAIGEIETGKVGFLDFKLNLSDKRYLMNNGMKTAANILDNISRENRSPGRRYVHYFHRTFRYPSL
jgi:Predicted esterase of the alpha-beta hydrolase superfamily